MLLQGAVLQFACCLCDNGSISVCLHFLNVRVWLRPHREGFNPDQSDKEQLAQALLSDCILLLESVAEQQNIVERMKLLQITKNLVGG